MLEEILKKNPNVLRVVSLVIRIFLVVFGVLVRYKERVLVVSYAGRRLDGSPRIIADKLLAQKYDIIFAKRANVSDEGLKTVRYGSIRYFWLLISSRIWISNTNIEMGLNLKRGGQIYVNTWHGIPFVRIGNCVEGRRDYDFSRVDVITTCSSYDEDIYLNCFNARPENFLRCGLPRNVSLLEGASSVKNGNADKELYAYKLLYAPTWRSDSAVAYRIYVEFINGWINYAPKNYQLLCKFHHLSGMDEKNVPSSHNVKILKGNVDLNQVMYEADALVTDYSSIYFDFSLLGKPTIFYMPDLIDYNKSRGFYRAPDHSYGHILDKIHNLGEVLDAALYQHLAEVREFHDYEHGQILNTLSMRFKELGL